MKKFYIILLSTFFLSFVNAQDLNHVNYDLGSKWFFGINGGATWSTTDVDDKLDLGWGLTLGRSFNYDYGKVFSFDIRARYLRGYWYGQDSDTTDLNNYQGIALNPYKDSLGYTVNNFQADLHRLSLELAIHFNWLREKTRLDPYIFGGVGVTWNQTYGDLYEQSANKGDIYQYEPNGSVGFGSASSSMDGIYDTALDGSEQGDDNYTASFMPSLGFGIGYQISNNVSIGLEHKTTFTLNDHFDGYNKYHDGNWVGVEEADKRENDLYHYTSAYLRFRLPNGRSSVSRGNESNSGCKAPKIYLASGLYSTLVVRDSIFNAKANIKYMISGGEVIIQNEKGDTLSHSFNSSTTNFESSLELAPGLNKYVITALNDCGQQSKTFTINYINCKTAQINIASKEHNQRDSVYTLEATIKNVFSKNNITLTNNGVAISSFTFNEVDGTLSAMISLNEGPNNLLLKATNDCLSDKKSLSLEFIPCLESEISFITPSVSGTTVNNSSFLFSAQISNYTKGMDIKLLLNNSPLTGFQITDYRGPNGSLSTIKKTLSLKEGLNQISLSMENECGKISKEITLLYDNCEAPQIIRISPSTTKISTDKKNYSVSLKIENTQSKGDISVTFNNKPIAFDYSISSKKISFVIANNSGMNELIVEAKNRCGSDLEKITFNYTPCVVPNITITSPSTNNITVKKAQFNFISTISGSQSNLNLTNNGVALAVAEQNLNNNTVKVESAINLSPGLNTIVLNAVNDCGTDTKTIVIVYDNCTAPAVAFSQPSASGSTVNQSSYSFIANVSNMNGNTNGINLILNGTSVPFNLNQNNVTATLNLKSGINTIVCSAINSCGSDSKTTVITYKSCQPPVLSLLSPINNSTTTSSSYILQANAIGIISKQNVSVKLNNVAVAFNYVAGNISGVGNLTPGTNVFVISATNSCGSDIKSISVTYNDCTAPVVSISSPGNGTVTTNQSASFSANVQNMNTSSGISLKINGVNKAFSYNNGSVSANISLAPGLNNVLLSATNSCGADAKTITLTYNDCTAPVVSISSPGNGTVTTNQSASFSANVQNMNTSSGISLKINGVNKAFSYNNGSVSANISLAPGLNNVSLSAANSCGADAKTITLTYNDCTAPVVSISSPSNNSQVTTSNCSIGANISGITNPQNISLSVNGINKPFSFSNGSLIANVTLAPGNNKIKIIASNNCGTDEKTSSIKFKHCTAPSVAINSPNNGLVTTNQTVSVNANIQNMSTQSGISLKLNGVSKPFSFSNGTLSANLSLIVGLNNITISANNSCGADAKTINLTYDDCTPPALSLNSPSSTTTNVNQSNYVVQMDMANYMFNQTNITVTMNGNSVPYTVEEGTIESEVTLVNGTNVITFTMTTPCGNVTQTITLIYGCNSPTINIITPNTNTTVNTNVFTLKASVSDVSGPQDITLKINGISQIFTFSNGILNATPTIQNGMNSVEIIASNSCGQSNANITIHYSQSNDNKSTNAGGDKGETVPTTTPTTTPSNNKTPSKTINNIKNKIKKPSNNKSSEKEGGK